METPAFPRLYDIPVLYDLFFINVNTNCDKSPVDVPTGLSPSPLRFKLGAKLNREYGKGGSHILILHNQLLGEIQIYRRKTSDRLYAGGYQVICCRLCLICRNSNNTH